jgi:hypothetical protein
MMPTKCKVDAKKMQTQKLGPIDKSPYFCSELVHSKSNQIKNLNVMKRAMLVMAVALMSALQVSAQNVKIDDRSAQRDARPSEKELVGVWLMESMQWEGEKKTMCGKQSGYAQFKYYGADGEYACAEIALTKEGKCVVMPHEYGTYTFKDGWYSEMGREAIKDAIVWVDKTTTKGTWQKRHDIWKKQLNMPEKLRKYIVDCCKMKNTPDDIQQMIKQTMFK